MSDHTTSDPSDSRPNLRETDQLSVARRRKALRAHTDTAVRDPQQPASSPGSTGQNTRERAPALEPRRAPGSHDAQGTALSKAFGLPVRLVRALRRRETLPVIGWGIGETSSNPMSGSEQSSRAIHESFLSLEPASRRQEAELRLASTPDWVTALYQRLSALEPLTMMALTPDPRLLPCLQENTRGWLAVDVGALEAPVGQRLLLRLGGTLETPETLLLTPRDLLSAAWTRPLLWQIAAGEAARCPLLVMGVTPEDSATRQLLCSLLVGAATEFAGWYVCSRVTPGARAAWEARGFEVLELDPMAWLSALNEIQPVELPAGEAMRSRGQERTSAPYKRLHYFERHESDIFFGRQRELRRLMDQVCGHRLTLVTGPSGAGKTSLLNAGLLAEFDRRKDHLGLYIRLGDNPVGAIRAAIVAALPGAGTRLEQEPRVSQMLMVVRDVSGRIPLLVIDQSEELFTRTGLALRQELFQVIRDCLLSIPLQARFVLALREDFLARLAELRDVIPTLLQNVFYLGELNRACAQEAIEGPARAFGVSLEPQLVDAILQDLGVEHFTPPQLQIVCSRLFEASPTRHLTLSIYQHLGGARHLLRSFLAGELQALGDEAADFQRVLKGMVTSEGTKEVLLSSEVALRSGLDAPRAEALLLQLRDRCRLVRSIHQDSHIRFELAHEYLTAEIWSWMTDEDKRQRQIEEFFVLEQRSWRRFRHLRLGLDRLSLFEDYHKLLRVDLEGLVLLLMSAVRHHRSPDLWTAQVKRLPEGEQDSIAAALFDYFYAREPAIRREAAETIAVLDPAPILRALDSPNVERRRAALEMLGGLELTRAVGDIVARIHDEDSEVRALACGALGEIGSPDAIEALMRAAQSDDPVVTHAAIRALGRVDSPQALFWIRSAVVSDSGELREAGHDALRFLRAPGLAVVLLNQGKLPSDALDILWEHLLDAAPRFAEAISKTVDKLPAESIPQALRLLSLSSRQWHRAALESLSGREGSVGELAKKSLGEAKKTESQPGNSSLRPLPTPLTLETLSAYIDQQPGEVVWKTGQHIAQKKDSLPILLKLVERAGVSQRVALEALYHIQGKAQLSERLLEILLGSSDASVRYLTCLVMEKHGLTGAYSALMRLLEDDGSPDWYYLNVGVRVRHAAAKAMEALHPASRVWSRPFQSSFRE